MFCFLSMCLAEYKFSLIVHMLADQGFDSTNNTPER